MKVNRKTQRGIRVMVFALALLLVLSAVPIGVYLSAPKVKAVNFNQLKSQIEGLQSGQSLQIDYDTSNTGSYTVGETVITVPANTTVTVNNAGRMAYNVRGSAVFPGISMNLFTVEEGATLNLTGGGTYRLNFTEDVTNGSYPTVDANRHKTSHARVCLVVNNGGTVHLGSANFQTHANVVWSALSTNVNNLGTGNAFVWNCAVWNNGDSSRTEIGEGCNINVESLVEGAAGDNFFADVASGNTINTNFGFRAYSYAYGVYGGQISMNGGSITLNNSAAIHGATSSTLAYDLLGIVSAGLFSDDIHLINGQINVTNDMGRRTAMNDALPGTVATWAVGLGYQTTPPVVDGGTINTTWQSSGNMSYRGVTYPRMGWVNQAGKASLISYAIAQMPTASSVRYSPETFDSEQFSQYNNMDYGSNADYTVYAQYMPFEFRWKESGTEAHDSFYREHIGDFSGEPQAGSATDSNGHTHIENCESSHAEYSGTSSIVKGNTTQNGVKNIVIYRYIHSDNRVEASFAPKEDIAAPITIQNVTDSGVTVQTNGEKVSYVSGGAPVVTYHWELRNVRVAIGNYDATAAIPLDEWMSSTQTIASPTELVSVSYPGPTHVFTCNPTAGYTITNTGMTHIIVWVDYYEPQPEQLRLELPENLAPAVGNLGFKLYGTRNTSDNTGDDDLLYDASSPSVDYVGVENITYSWESVDGGKSGDGLPIDAGDYYITVYVAANPETNRAALAGTKLDKPYHVTRITSVTFGILRTTLTYPQTLGDVDLTQLKPLGGLPAEIVNDFDFAWMDGYDMSTIPNAADAPQFFRLKATVKEEMSGRYDLQGNDPVIDVYIDVKPLDVVVSFADTEITYGDPIDEIYKDITFSANVERQEDKDAVIEIIKSHGGLAVATDSGDVPYTPGDILANEDGYDLVFPGGTGIVSGNYSISAAKGGHLTVAKRALTVAVNVPGPIVYTPGVSEQTVEIAAGDVSGVLDIDAYGPAIYVQPITVKYPNGGNATTPAAPLTGPSATELEALQGAKWNCYYVSEVIYGSLEITQATPVEGTDYNIPSLPTDVIYDPLVTIGDLLSREDFQAALSAACLKDGEFTVVNEKEIPNAGTSAYVFTYTPTDKNYSAVEGIQVPLTVAKREIKVSVKHVELRYGDNAPDPSTFEWTFDNWTSVDTTGKDFIPPFRSENGMIVYNTGYTKESLGVYRDELNYYLRCDYDASETAPAAGSVFQIVESVDGTSIADLVANNYTFTFTPGTLAVYPKDLHIAMPDVHVAYNSLPTDPTVFDLTVTEDDLVGNDTLAGMISEGNHLLHFQYTDADGKAYEPGVDAGTPGYKVDMHIDPALKNYNLVIEEGKLIIDPMEITIRPKDMIVEYGDTVDLSAAGFESDPYVEDLSTVFTGNIKVDTDYDSSRPETSGVGEYHIRILEDQDIVVNKNYKVVFGDYNATLTITQGRLTADGFNHELTFQYDAVLTLGDQLLAQEGKNRATLYHGTHPVEGTLTYVNSNEILTVTGSPYTMSMTFVPDDANYATVSDLSGKVFVNPAELTGVLQIYGTLMVDETITPGLLGLNLTNLGSFRFEWFLVEADGSATSISTEPSLVILDEYVGKRIRLVATVDEQVEANYVGSDSCITPTISTDVYKIEAGYLTMTGGGETVYTGEPQAVGIQLIDEMVGFYEEEITIRYNGSTEAPTNVGTYYITADCPANNLFAATDGLSIGTLIITPKHINVSFTVNEKIYDATTSGSVSPENVTTEDIVPNDVGTVNLVTAHVRARFSESNVGDAVQVTLSNYYLEGVGYTNYTLDETTVGVGKIVPATVKVEPRLEVEEIDWSENLTQWEISGVRVYFTNFDGVKARDRAYFSVAPDTVALIDPKGGEYAQVDTDTISAVIEASHNCEKNYVLEVVEPAEPLTIFVRMIEPDEMKDFPRELRMTERTYDSRQHLTNEELRSFIATVDGGKYADLADSFTWVVSDDGLTPVPEASSTSTPRSYFAVYKDTTNPNTTDVQVRIRIPVNARPITITALPVASVVYGSENPLADAQSELYSVSGLEDGVTLESAFGTLPEVQTNYLQYSPVGSYDITVNTGSLRNVNYSITAVPSSFTVTQRELRTVATATNKAYDGLTDNILVTFSELTGKAREADEVYLPDSVYGTIADPNAGAGKRVTITTPALEGLSKDNYYLVVENLNGLTVTVSKLDPLNYTFPARAVLTYGEPLSEARLEGADGDGVFAFTQPNLIPTDTGVFENLYTMTFTPSNSNYNTVSRRVTVEVEVAQLNIRIVLTGSLYVGNVLTANTQGVPAGALQYLHYSWYRIDPTTGEQTPIGTDSATYTLTNADVGCTLRVTVSIAEGEPYVGSAETVSETILEEVLTFWQRFWRWWQKLFAAIAGLFRR